MKIDELQKALRRYDKITILGHNNIDVDAFLSGILLSHLLDFLNIKNEFVILEEIKENQTYQIIKEQFNIDLRGYYSEGEKATRNLFLEDHFETNHLGQVVACLDHHPTNRSIEYPFYHSRISCSTSYLVYELMQEANYVLSKKEAKMILVAMMVDTVSFRSTKTVKMETIKAKQLAEQYKLDYEDLEKYCLCLNEIKGAPLDVIINNGYKYYNYNGKRVKSSYLQIYEMVEKDELTIWLKTIKQKVKVEALEIWVFILFECKNGITYEYHVSKEKVEKVTTQGILSRGTNIMPKIEAQFSK